MIIDHSIMSYHTVINNHLIGIYELKKHWSILYYMYYIICNNST